MEKPTELSTDLVPRRREALENAYRVFARKVVGWTRGRARPARRGGATDADDVHDIVQEVFTRALSALSKGRHDASRSLDGYLYGIFKHVWVDRARRARREIATDFGPGGRGAALSEELSPSDRHHWDPTVLRLTEVYINSLSVELRSLHTQRFVVGQSQRAAAAALGTSRRHVRTLEERLKQGLRRRLHHDGAV